VKNLSYCVASEILQSLRSFRMTFMSLISNWKRYDKDFNNAIKSSKEHDYEFQNQPLELDELKAFLVSKVDFLLRLLENPNLLEHESFTDLLWAVLHLEEELSYRKTLKELPNSDYAHLSGDIKRAYGLVISEWLTYIKHLKYNYPYLFSLAIRMNPLNKDASPLVK